MALTASEFRKHLFTHLETAAKGGTVEIVYRGVKLRVKPVSPVASKFATGKEYGIIVGNLTAEGVTDQWEGMSEWEAEVEELFGGKK